MKSKKLIVIVIIAAIAAACAKPVNHPQPENMPAKTIEEVLKQHAPELMSIQGVVGTAEGLCEGKPCIKVYILKKTPEQQKIPDSLEGYPVVIEETGEFKAFPEKK